MLQESLRTNTPAAHPPPGPRRPEAEKGLFLIRIPKGAAIPAPTTNADTSKASGLPLNSASKTPPEEPAPRKDQPVAAKTAATAGDTDLETDWCAHAHGAVREPHTEAAVGRGADLPPSPTALDTSLGNKPNKERPLIHTPTGAAASAPSAPSGKQIWLDAVDYEPFRFLFPLAHAQIGALFQVVIRKSWMSSAGNPAVRKRCLWGGADGIYTDDSDPVCILKHNGCEADAAGPLGFVKATFCICAPQETYPATDRCGVRSRSWAAGHHGMSIRYVRCEASKGRIRRKERPLARPEDGPACMLAFSFSSHSRMPTLPYSDLLGWPERVRLALEQQATLILEGASSPSSCCYRLRQHNGRYTLSRTDCSGRTAGQTADLFAGLEWAEIDWQASGLSAQSTLINVTGYRWG